MSDAFRTRIRRPIFLCCLSRGGSNIFWNLFLSHPDVCSPIRETLEIFRLDHRAPTRAGLFIALLSGQPRFFDQWKLAPRRSLGGTAARYLDRVLAREKLRTLDDPEMRFKSATEVYTREDVEAARLVAKNNNGLVFLNDTLRSIYPDATFFALVRHPLALWESHKRRRLHRSPEAFVRFYRGITERMLVGTDPSRGGGEAHLVRFEDVLAEPLDTLTRIYAAAGLDLAKVSALRFKSKRHFREDGSRGADWEVGRHRWLDFEEVPRFLEPRINALQSDRLTPEECRIVLEGTAAVRERLGYGDEG